MLAWECVEKPAPYTPRRPPQERFRHERPRRSASLRGRIVFLYGFIRKNQEAMSGLSCRAVFLSTFGKKRRWLATFSESVAFSRFPFAWRRQAGIIAEERRSGSGGISGENSRGELLGELPGRTPGKLQGDEFQGGIPGGDSRNSPASPLSPFWRSKE